MSWRTSPFGLATDQPRWSRCTGCTHVWRQDTSNAAEPRGQSVPRGLRWALEGLVVAHPKVARVAEDSVIPIAN